MANDEDKKLDEEREKKEDSSPRYNLSSLEKIIRQERNRIVHYKTPLFGRRTSIEENIEMEKGQILNQGLRQDIRLRKITLWILLSFLAVETIIIFSFSFFQATKIFNFQLEEWSFKLLVAATISQITYMLQVAVKYLFPLNKK